MAAEIKKYSAFISYKHGDLDTFVAENLHKAIETYQVPKNIQKMTGKKKIERVFRDKDELPISSNLSDNISEALQNSEYLIVVCSPRTPESYWVQKEIETFIQMHDRDHVLAVLIEGEPQEAFPEQLQFIEEERKAEDGTVQIERIPIEPLAADLRAENRSGVKKKMKTEILRIMAPLLGCGYDDLRQRHKERRMRRIIGICTGITVFFVAFGIYSTYNTVQINLQYQNKQRNQSRYLAETSQRLLQEGDREMAVKIALEALPEQEGAKDRPYVPEAEYALNNALGVYSDGYEFEIEHRLNVGGNVEEMVISDDNTLLAARDNMQNLYVWETGSYEMLFELKAEYDELYYRKDWIDIGFNANDQLLGFSVDTVDCWDSRTGELLWEKEYSLLHKCVLNRDKTECFIYSDAGCQILDSVTGEVLAERKDYKPNRIVLFSPDNQYVVFDVKLEEGYGVVLWNLETDAAQMITDDEWLVNSIDSLAFAGTKGLIVSASHLSEETLLEVIGSTKMYQIDTLEQEWENQEASFDLSVYYYADDTAFENPILVYTSNDSICILDKDTGKVTACSVGDAVVFAKPISDSSCFFVDATGETGILSWEINSYSILGTLSGNHIRECVFMGDSVAYWNWNDNAIMVSTRRIGESFQGLSDENYPSGKNICSADGNYMLHEEIDELMILSLEDGAVLETIEDVKQFSLYQDTDELIYLDTENYLHRYDLTSRQEIESKQVTEDGSIGKIAFSQDGSRIAILSANGSVLIYDTADFSQCAVLEECSLRNLVISNDGNFVVGTELNQTLSVYETVTGKKIELEETGFGVMKDTIAVAHMHPWVVVNGTDQMVHVIDMETGKTLYRLAVICPDKGFLEFTQDDSRLMIADIDNCITLYDLEADTVLKKIMVEDNGIEDVTYLPEQELCILINSTEAYLLTTKEDSYSIIAQVPGYMGMDGGSDRIFVNNYRNGFGYFQYQSLDDLIAQGKELIKDEELTEQEKNTYYVE